MPADFLGEWLGKVWVGDCLEFMRQLPDESVDMVFTDPPYGNNNNNNRDLISRWEAALGRGEYMPLRDNRPIANDGPEANALIRACFVEFARLLKPGACCCCCCCGGGGPDPQFARWSLWLDEAVGFKMCVVWDKGGLGMGWHYRRCWECILVGQKPGGAAKWYGGNDEPNIIRRISKIIPQREQHPTEKPVALSAWFLRLHSAVGDVVLDPFVGHGSTLVACERLGRRWLGCEINPEYAAIAEKRVAAERAKVKLPLEDA